MQSNSERMAGCAVTVSTEGGKRPLGDDMSLDSSQNGESWNCERELSGRRVSPRLHDRQLSS